MKTVKEVAALSGVSVRTLHYYDSIGLLEPESTTRAGYRLYGEKQLARLQQIMFLRELDFSISDISGILASGGSARDMLEKQRELLLKKRDRLDGLVGLIENLIEGEDIMGFEKFDMTEIETSKELYRKEAAERWGGTEAFRQSEEKTAAYTKEDWQAVSAEMQSVLGGFVGIMDKGPSSPEARAAVEKLQAHITTRYYDCTNEILAGLGEMYVKDERFKNNIDKNAEGLASFINEAIRCKLG
jgi:DNA-binding transcriptional MerR regulator